MRNLVLFLRRFSSLLIFILLEVLSLVFIVRNHSYHKASFINSTNYLTANIYQSYFELGEYLFLKAVNDSLMKENKELRELAHQSPLYTVSAKMVDECEEYLPYEYIPAKVINSTTNRINNHLTLDKGWLSGIREEMGVIGPNGIIGIVTETSDNFSAVMSVLHKNARISVKLKKFNYPGNLQWNGGNPKIANVVGIPQYVPVETGDTVVTSGFSAIFPENIMVGIVTEIHAPDGNNFYDIKLRLSTNFETTRYGYVVNNIFREEQKTLESSND